MNDYENGYKDGYSDGKMEGCNKMYEHLRQKILEIRDTRIKDDNFVNVGIDEAIENAEFNSGLREAMFLIWKAMEDYVNAPLEKDGD